MKFSFKNDYSEGCHPNILQAFLRHNLDQQAGYGEDEYSLQAKELIKEKIKKSDCINAFYFSIIRFNIKLWSGSSFR